MSGPNGVTVVGPAARRAKWAQWYVCRVAGALVVGRLFEKRTNDDGWERYLQPFYDFNSGFVQTPQGIMEVHKAWPPMALSLQRLDLPPSGFVLWPFADLDDAEIEGMEITIADAENLWKQMRAARSGVLVAKDGAVDLSKLPPMPRK